MKDRIKDYFSFNRKEQRGLITLLGLMLLSVAANIFLPSMLPEKEYDTGPFRKEVEEFLAAAQKPDSLKRQGPARPSYHDDGQAGPVLEAFRSSPFYFDPNEMTEKQWTSIGMDTRIMKNILRYREKGGKFRDKEGFRKIYGMSDSVFAILDPYLQFAEKDKPRQFENKDSIQKSWQEKPYQKYQPDTSVIELNSADSASLLSLNGIGPSYAGRIIKYRNRLGGFYRPEQLLEVKGMDSIRFSQFRSRVTADPALVRKIDLNTVTFKDLLKHPYFEYYLVKAIFSKKDEVKSFDSVVQLRYLPVMYEELYLKIENYLYVK